MKRIELITLFLADFREVLKNDFCGLQVVLILLLLQLVRNIGNIRLSFILLLMVTGVACRQGANDGDLSNRLDSLFQSIPDFSGVALVADKGKVVYHNAFGWRNVEDNIPLDTADIFELASISKQFTSMIIMMLAEDGKLRFDDSLHYYLPALPYDGITLRHLLTHTSGVPDYQEVMDQHWDKRMVASNEDNIEYLIRYRPDPLFQPGEKYAYSNTGYMLLATVAEVASGEDFIALCQQRIFQPLRLTDTGFRTPAERRSIERFTSGYLYVEEEHRYVNADSFPEFNYTIWLGNRKGPGRISSTSHDLLLWDRALYSDRLVTKVTMSEAFAPARLLSDSLSYYGFGWVLRSDSLLGNVVSHTGGNPGYKTEIVRFIDADKTIILLNNNAHEKKEEIISAIKVLVRGGMPSRPTDQM
jgi:CubicO group peptidase (beta-lactamase class C family)